MNALRESLARWCREVAAEYRKGVLTITLPKTETAKTRKFKVKS